jgi:hypothetical protein
MLELMHKRLNLKPRKFIYIYIYMYIVRYVRFHLAFYTKIKCTNLTRDNYVVVGVFPSAFGLAFLGSLFTYSYLHS